MLTISYTFVWTRLVRKFKDLTEEKDQLEASCSNLTSDLEELKTNQHNNKHQPHRFGKQLSWSTTSSVDLDHDTSSVNNRPVSRSNDYNEDHYHSNNNLFNNERLLTDSTSYNKQTDSVFLLTKYNTRSRNTASPTPSFDVDERNRYIQTPSGMTALRAQNSFDSHHSHQQYPTESPLPTEKSSYQDGSAHKERSSQIERSAQQQQQQQQDRMRNQKYQSSTPIKNDNSATKRRLLYEKPTSSVKVSIYCAIKVNS